MKRINPQDVLKAYEDLGIMPIFANWGGIHNGNECACALTALGSQKKDYNEILDNLGVLTRPYGMFAELLECDEDYIEGFVYGFDYNALQTNTLYIPHKTLEFYNGYTDGKETADLVGSTIGFYQKENGEWKLHISSK